MGGMGPNRRQAADERTDEQRDGQTCAANTRVRVPPRPSPWHQASLLVRNENWETQTLFEYSLSRKLIIFYVLNTFNSFFYLVGGVALENVMRASPC